MKNDTRSVSRRQFKTVLIPSHIEHRLFPKTQSAKEFAADHLLETPIDYSEKYMPDDVTRDHARRMHYAAYRMNNARTMRDVQFWQAKYLALRDRIVVGNRKLIYRAVRRRMAVSNRMDDFIGDCHIVLIQAVAAYNPWLGIRFSTYAYTCIVRALARMSQKMSNDWMNRSVSLDAVPECEPGTNLKTELASSSTLRLDEYLRDDHPLLSAREKAILQLRFRLNNSAGSTTLETVGEEIGLSKERVRQVQASALNKLRKALTETV
jgi:RNA polymerase sigma factor (sigma-70 family)